MSPEHFGKVERLFFEAAELPPEDQPAFLDRACAGDDSVRAEVEGLLRQHGKSGGVATAPLVQPVDKVLQAAAADSSERALKLVGSSVGAYRITGVLAGGGMGVIYAGRDTRLGRAVAVKAVMPAFTDDPVWLGRFHREARILASLNHPNVATVFGLEESQGRRYLVMELLDGQTLARRLGKGALPVHEALRVCAQVAAGLQAAHDADVVHRDLKPANVMLLPDGRVKVLDFGLAREVDAGLDAPPGPTTLPIHGVSGQGHATRHGAVIGTPGYMSPEQVRGLLVDRRTDVFAFGCVLYECLTGRVAFPGKSGADIIVAVLERDPDWSLLPGGTPASVLRLLKRCCAKDLSERLRDMSDVRLALEDAIAERGWQDPRSLPVSPRAARRRLLLALPWLLLVGVLIAAATLWPRGAGQDPDAAGGPPVRRFAVAFPGNNPQDDLSRVRVALSRDGSQLAASASDGTERHIWRLGRDETALRRVEGTLDAWLPSFSPDGGEVVYFDGGAMRRRRPSGGGSVKVTDAGGHWGGYHWGRGGEITYVPYRTHGVARVPAAGGAPVFVTTPDRAAGEAAHVGPVATHDGRAVLYTVWDGRAGTRIDAADVATRARHTVVRDGATPRIARTRRGTFLLWARAGTLFAAPLDAKRLALAGPETAVADGVMFDRALLAACYDVADDGTLAYVPGPSFSEESRLAWLDVGDEADPQPARATDPINDYRLAFAQPQMTADGRRLSVLVRGDVYRPFLYDLQRGSFERVVLDGDCASASVSPEGARLAYSTNKDGPYALWLRDLDTGFDRKLHEGTAEYHGGVEWSHDGKHIAFSMAPKLGERRDVIVLDLGSGKSKNFCAGKGDERAAEFSPNGRWLAYVSDESGAREVYVRSFSDGRRNVQVTSDGGDWPQWSPAGDRVYFRNKGRLYSVPFSAADGSAGRRPRLEYDRRFGQADFDRPDYTVGPDGRLLLVEPSERGPTVSEIRVVLNWPSLIGK